ncbi:MAG: UDP-N-acetylmuramoyl-tripeptide--D-alanyl-D-alanine ligase [Verrucomicrobiota bacterium]
MKPLALDIVTQYCGGRLISGRGDLTISLVDTDSRKIQPGSLFVALRGETHDGHDYIQAAVQAGAAAVMVEKEISVENVAVIRVEDTLRGLQELARNYRRSLKTRVVGVTGSSGKSSTKEMIASVLSQKFKTHKTEGNLNNHIGVPLTLLACNEDHEWAVVEIGMNHPGEIAPLAAMIQPTIGVVTNVGWTHIWTFENQDALAREKAALLSALPSSGIAVLNADDARVRGMVEMCEARAVLAGEGTVGSYGFDSLRFSGEEVRFELHTRKGSTDVTLQVPAPHMVRNAVLAAAVGGELGLSAEQIARGLEQTKLPPGRCAVHAWKKGWLVDDTYNANPDSMIAGFEMLQVLMGKGRCVALLGAMGELGSYSQPLHEMVGATAAQKGVGLLFALGEDSKWMIQAAQKNGLTKKTARWFKNHEELAEAYVKSAKSDDKILVKGSRSQTMEKVLDLIRAEKNNQRGGVLCCSI